MSIQNKKILFHTLGCKMNFAESSTIGKRLLEAGFQKAEENEAPDICIINTCSVTEVADRKDRQAIKQLITKYPNAYIIVIGCYAQLKPEAIAKIEGVDLILGTQNKFDILDYMDDIEKKNNPQIVHTQRSGINKFSPSCTRGDRTRFWLKVQDGCDNFCSYCTVPIARGKSRNDSIVNTVAQAQYAVDMGAKEIVISGVNIGDFGKSTNETFYDLIVALDKIEGDYRYRISSIEPDLLSEEIIQTCAHSRHFVPHFHIPLQSGCDEVLALMKRHYDTALFASKIDSIKKAMPNAFIGVDVIVGTNGETEEYFNQTYQFIKRLDISQLHVFSYSERPNTQALKIGNKVTVQEKKRRSEILHQLSEEKRVSFYQSQIGNVAEVLWEERKEKHIMKGFTPNYICVERAYDEKLVNTLTKVKLGSFNADLSALTIASETNE
ncbi:MAG: tRNA (N(6)-L-threonylcarbamoyladenosine(37)-C(2))-methylthiotransferase MtaB [Paludibacteraceae bacterium]|nr:tRNA (N(6)-L-threonylcarbamoyladenosine(37)-C(2))-methylthiotransferase MtaB [Paludibacteraceae bacterium]